MADAEIGKVPRREKEPSQEIRELAYSLDDTASELSHHSITRAREIRAACELLRLFARTLDTNPRPADVYLALRTA